MSARTEAAEHRQQITEYLRKVLTPGATIYSVTMGYTDHGCTVKVLTVSNGDILDITAPVALVAGATVNKHGHYRFRGKGLSPIDSIAHTLEWKLWPDSDRNRPHDLIRGRAL